MAIKRPVEGGNGLAESVYKAAVVREKENNPKFSHLTDTLAHDKTEITVCETHGVDGADHIVVVKKSTDDPAKSGVDKTFARTVKI